MADNFFAQYLGSSGGSSGGVTELNSMTGALTLVAGSGITITPGSGTLTIAASGGGGASTSLNNLTATSINAALIPDGDYTRNIGAIGAAWGLVHADSLIDSTETNSVEVGDGEIFIQAGVGPVSIQAGDGSPVTFRTANQSLQSSGAVNINTGDTAAFVSGAVTVKSGASTASGSGNVIVSSGTSAGADSGFALLASGDSSAAGTGPASVSSGQPATNSNSGAVEVSSGAASGSGASGTAKLKSGDTSNGDTGTLTIGSGTASGVGASGNIFILSGDAGATSGNVYLFSGSANGASASGFVSIGSGVNNDSAPSGDVSLSTGNGGTGQVAGNIVLTPGTGNVGSGARGFIRLQNGTEGTAGHVWTSTDASGSGSWAPAPESPGLNSVGLIRAFYDFGINGGAVGDIQLSDGIPGNLISLPPGATVTKVYASALGAPSSGTSAATIGLTLALTNDLMAATPIASFIDTPVTFLDGIPSGLASTFVWVSNTTPLQMTIGVEDLTSGQIEFFIEYVIR